MQTILNNGNYDMMLGQKLSRTAQLRKVEYKSKEVIVWLECRRYTDKEDLWLSPKNVENFKNFEAYRSLL